MVTEAVAVTGLGATTPLGGDVASTWAAMLAGESGIGPIAEDWSAGLPAEAVGVVHAHATSTPLGDLAEAGSVAEAIGTHPVVTATKSMTGHLFGAAGSLGALAAILAVRDGVVPPTRNLDTLDPAVALDVVTGGPRRVRAEAALTNAFGFGGHNASLLFTQAR